mmetsp:Transcript_14519/g.54857  ORF Transcript_14519/g.54857 Transcript_14519/m.54857 type:complete len:334 (-) Transcript_14519:224-1225(-)
MLSLPKRLASSSTLDLPLSALRGPLLQVRRCSRTSPMSPKMHASSSALYLHSDSDQLQRRLSSRTTALWPASAATHSAVRFWLSVAFLAFRHSRRETTSSRPCAAAASSGVVSLKPGAPSTSAPWSSKSFTDGACPHLDAARRGVAPLCVTASRSAPFSRRSLKATSFPVREAAWSGVSPHLPFALIAAPYRPSSKRDTTATCPLWHAKCRGVKPSRSLALMSAPASSSRRATSSFPHHAAEWSGVTPRGSLPETSAPESSSSRASSTRPRRAARSSALHLPSCGVSTSISMLSSCRTRRRSPRTQAICSSLRPSRSGQWCPRSKRTMLSWPA